MIERIISERRFSIIDLPNSIIAGLNHRHAWHFVTVVLHLAVRAILLEGRGAPLPPPPPTSTRDNTWTYSGDQAPKRNQMLIGCMISNDIQRQLKLTFIIKLISMHILANPGGHDPLPF